MAVGGFVRFNNFFVAFHDLLSEKPPSWMKLLSLFRLNESLDSIKPFKRLSAVENEVGP